MKVFSLKNSLVYTSLVLMFFIGLCDTLVFACENNSGQNNDNKKVCANITPDDWKKRIKGGEIIYYCSHNIPPSPERRSCPSDLSIPEWSSVEKKRREFPEKCLKTLLSDRKEVPNQGVRLQGYAFNDGLNLSNMALTRHLSLNGCFFEKEVDLSGIIAPYGISFKNSYFKGCLKLTNADITGTLNMDGTTCTKVHADGMKVDGSVSIKKSTWKEAQGKDERDTFAANFYGAKIKGQIILDESVFNGDVRMHGISVGSQMTAEQSQFLGNLFMQGAVIKRRLCLKGATIKKDFLCRGAELGAKVFLGKSEIKGTLDMTGVQANGGINMQNAVLTHLVLTNGKIVGPLEMKKLQVNSIDAKGMAVEGSAFLQYLKLNTPGQSTCPGKAEFQCARINGQLILDGAVFNGDVNLQGIFIKSQLQAEKNVKFFGDVNLQGAKIQRRISFKEAEIQKNLNFQGAEIGGKLFLDKSNINGKFNMSGTVVEGDISMNEGQFRDVDFVTTHINGKLSMNDCNISGDLKNYGIYVKDIYELKGSRCIGITHMHRSFIGSTLDLRNTKFFKNIILKGAHINGDLFIDHVEFKSLVDMKGIHIDGEFIINDVKFSSETDSRFQLNLANINIIDYKYVQGLKYLDLSLTNVDRMIVKVRNRSDWPDHMDLRGFVYKQIRGEYTGAEAEEEEFFKSWLEQLKKYSPQPFEQCAKVLRQEGHFAKANEVLASGKEAETAKAFEDGNYSRWVGLTLLRLSIGYGIGLGYFWALLWVVIFVIIGTWWCYVSRHKDQWNVLWKSENEGKNERKFQPFICLFLYNLDMILPMVTLREKHKKVEPPFSFVIYFCFLKLFGWALASFIIAGLAGITQG